MFENIIKFFKRLGKKEEKESSDTAKERLHLVLMQDRANVSADFLELMRKEIIEVIKKYIDVDEKAIDVRLTNKTNDDGTVGAPALYANIPIVTIKNEARAIVNAQNNEEQKNDSSKNNNENQEENIKEVKSNEKVNTDNETENQQEQVLDAKEEESIQEHSNQEILKEQNETDETDKETLSIVEEPKEEIKEKILKGQQENKK